MIQARSRESGFTLLEVIVAMAIASMALATIYQTIGGGMRASARVKALQSVTIQARTHLDALGSDGTLKSGTSTGAYENGIRWRLGVTDLSTKIADANALKPYWITLDTFDKTGATLFKLETAKIAREAQP